MSEKYSKLQRAGMLVKAAFHIRNENFRDAASLVTGVVTDRIERFVERKVIKADFDKRAGTPIEGVFHLPLLRQYSDYEGQLKNALKPLKEELADKGIEMTMSGRDRMFAPDSFGGIPAKAILKFAPAAKLG